MTHTLYAHNRLEADRLVLARYMPQFELRNNEGTLCFEGWQSTNSGRRYRLRLLLPPGYPDERPDLLVVWPTWLRKHDGGTIASEGASHSFHSLGGTDEGYLRLCHTSSWNPWLTCLAVFLKGVIWLAAYDAHLATGRPLSDFVRS